MAERDGLRVGYVPGVTPGKWERIWGERQPAYPLTLVPVEAIGAIGTILAGEIDAGLVRSPVDRDVVQAIELYTETTVVVLPVEHLLTAGDELTYADLADDDLLQPLDDTLPWPDAGPPSDAVTTPPATTAAAVELVAAGAGLVVVPQSLARLHHRRDVTYRPLTDAPESTVYLAWPQGETGDLVDQFIGVVRGRTANSSRGRSPEPAAQPADRKKSPDRRSGRKPTAQARGRSQQARGTGRRKPRR